jgi:hypothetical protein
MPGPDLGQIALQQAHEHGLHGRADSPPEWQRALVGAIAGEPILVKDPEDSRDDFYLLSFRTAADATRTAWVILDCVTLKLREASLLDHWPVLAFPDPSDCKRAANRDLMLADGTIAKFRPEDFRYNRNNLVWKASAASILPYWPMKELIAPHPLTREPVSIYVTQNGDVYAQLTSDEPLIKKQSSGVAGKVIRYFLISAIAATAGFLMHRTVPVAPQFVTQKIVEEVESPEMRRDRDHFQKLLEETTAALNRSKNETAKQDTQVAILLQRIQEKERIQKKLESVIAAFKASQNAHFHDLSPEAPLATVPEPTPRPEIPERLDTAIPSDWNPESTPRPELPERSR